MAYLQPTSEGVILRIRVQPRASRREIAGVAGECLKVRVNAPPAGGAANRQCCELLAKLMRIPKGRVELVSGAKSREKRILLRSVDEAFVSSRMSEILEASG